MDQADLLVGAEQSRRHAGFPQQPFEPGMTTRVPTGAVVGRLVEVRASVLYADEQRPFRVPIFVSRHCPGRCEHDLQLR